MRQCTRHLIQTLNLFSIGCTRKPVIASSGQAEQGLRIVHCSNTTYSSGNTFVGADGTNNDWDSSLILDANSNPVVSYYNPVGKNLKILHCSTPTCL